MIEGRAQRLRDIPLGRFACIAADPGTEFTSWDRSTDNPRSPQSKYRTMAIDRIARMPVREFAARDSFLFLWCTGPLIAVGAHITIIRGWGFEPSGFAFVWAKTNPLADVTALHCDRDFAMNGGYGTRHNAEVCFLGRRGSPERLSRGVRELIVSPRREHSRKPDQFFERVQQLCNGPRLELFARQQRPGWLVWGNEAEKFI